jgi:caa(3)-type oxidase subunit IV
METEHEEHFPNYIFVWFVLLALTGTSIVASILVKEFAPVLEMALLGFLFILGVIKASLVVSNFMHLRFERRFLWILGLIALFFVGFFIAGTYFDLTLTQKR